MNSEPPAQATALTQPASTPPRPPTYPFAIVFLVWLLIVITATLVTYILPESYASTARIRIERDISDIRGMLDSPNQQPYDPYFIQTESEVIQSELVLSNVVQNLQLREEWGKKYAGGQLLKTPETLAMLKCRTDLRLVRNTSLIEIRVYSENPDEAARIANAIAETYRDYRRDQRRKLTLDAIRVLEERFAEQDKKVKEATDVVEKLRKELNISESDPMGTQPGALLEAETLRRLLGMLIESQAAYVKGDKLLQELKATPPEELKNILPTAMQDVLLNGLLQQLNLAEQERIRLRKDLDDKSPAVATATKQIEDLERKIATRCTGIIKGLEANVTSLSNYVSSIASDVSQAKKNDIAKSEKSRPYYEAKQKLEELVRFRAALNSKLAAEKIDVEIPKTTMVEIVDRATPGFKPVRPNKVLNILLGVIVGGICGFSLATIVYVLQRLAARRASGIARTQLPPRIRAILHVAIALAVGIVIGYRCASPVDLTNFIMTPLILVLGGCASAWIEFANLEAAPPPRRTEPPLTTKY